MKLRFFHLCSEDAEERKGVLSIDEEQISFSQENSKNKMQTDFKMDWEDILDAKIVSLENRKQSKSKYLERFPFDNFLELHLKSFNGLMRKDLKTIACVSLRF